MRPIAFVRIVGPLVAFAASARADIFQWEYINPPDPSQGKQQSTTLCPGGSGVAVNVRLDEYSFSASFIGSGSIHRAASTAETAAGIEPDPNYLGKVPVPMQSIA